MTSSVLEVPHREVPYRGETLKVAPLRIGQIPPFARAIGPMFAALADIVGPTPPPVGGGEGRELLVDIEELVGLAGDYGERMIEAVAVATGQSVENVAAGDPVEFIDLLVAVVEVNADFFARAVAKAQRAAAAASGSKAAGPNRSSS